MTLYNLKISEPAIIESIHCDIFLKQRLYDLGLIKDTIIIPLFKSPFGDPIAYYFRGNIIAIRNNEAKQIYIKCKKRKED